MALMEKSGQHTQQHKLPNTRTAFYSISAGTILDKESDDTQLLIDDSVTIWHVKFPSLSNKAKKIENP